MKDMDQLKSTIQKFLKVMAMKSTYLNGHL